MSLDQQIKLMDCYIGSSENAIKRHISVELTQYEFDSLVSFAGNPGRGKTLTNVCDDINHGDVKTAMMLIRSVLSKDPRIRAGLMNRREAEIALYLYGKYNA